MVKRGFIVWNCINFIVSFKTLSSGFYSILLTWRTSSHSPLPHLCPRLFWIITVNLLPVGLHASPVLMNPAEKRQDDCHQMATSAEEHWRGTTWCYNNDILSVNLSVKHIFAFLQAAVKARSSSCGFWGGHGWYFWLPMGNGNSAGRIYQTSVWLVQVGVQVCWLWRIAMLSAETGSLLIWQSVFPFRQKVLKLETLVQSSSHDFGKHLETVVLGRAVADSIAAAEIRMLC